MFYDTMKRIKKWFSKFKTIKILLLIFIWIIITLSIVKYYPQKTYAQNDPTITEFYPAFGAGSFGGITTGPDGNLWFTEMDAAPRIWRITPSGITTSFALPNDDYIHYLGAGIITGHDGNLWFTEIHANKIGRITPSGTITEFPVPTDNSFPSYITSGPDGNLWFTEWSIDKIGRITTDGEITEFNIPSSNTSTSLAPEGITPGPDGNLWFTEYQGNKIGSITTNGEITEFQIPTDISKPRQITRGNDGNLWFTEAEANKIGKITPKGIITEYSVSTPDSYPISITAGEDGNIWFTEGTAKKIGRITPSGSISELPVPSNNSPSYITTGPDGNIWFTEQNKIGRVNLSNTITPVPTITPTQTPSGNILNVPYFSQNVDPWGQSEYDHTNALGLTGYLTTINTWGCAVSSVAMVLRYHNMNEFADGTPIDPGSVNTWLKNNNGYFYGYGSDGWYSYIDWTAIGRLTKELYDAGKSSVKLEYKFISGNPTPQTKEILNKDLTEGINEFGPFPDILWVNNSGHFIVAKGILDNTYAINDPEWDYKDLSYFDNNFTQVGRYIPSKTDLSYLVLVVNPNVELLVTDSQGRKTGKYIHNGIIETYNEIPNTSYGFEHPISNPNIDGGLDKLGTGVNSFLLPNPPTNNFTITLSSNSYQKYTLNSSSLTEEGDNNINKLEGTTASNIDNKFSLSYDKHSTESADLKPDITFDKLKADLQELFNQGFIDDKKIYISLLLQVQAAEKASNMKIQPLGNKLAVVALKIFLLELNAQRGKHVKEEAYQILNSEARLLIDKLKVN